jgi:hypothetical protein
MRYTTSAAEAPTAQMTSGSPIGELDGPVLMAPDSHV